MEINVELNENEYELVKAYADISGVSVPELLRSSALDRIENEADLRAYEDAMAEYEADPVTHRLDEVIKELDLG